MTKVAVRLVAWSQHDAGFIDNIPGTRTYPTSGVTINNKAFAKADYNDVDTYGARVALLLDVNDNWTVRPTLMAQDTKSNGIFGFDDGLKKYQVKHFLPEGGKEVQSGGLTVQGKISDFDLVYAGSYMDRKTNTNSDYTDYSYFYDTLFGSGAYITDASGKVIDPTQRITGDDHFTKQSHEIRLSSPQDWRIRFLVGAFQQRQTHLIEQNYHTHRD